MNSHIDRVEDYDIDEVYNNNSLILQSNDSLNCAVTGHEQVRLLLTPKTGILILLLCTLIVITIVGNLLVCLAVILVKKLRRPQNYLLVSLATSDLMVALSVMPFAIVNEVHANHWPLNATLCDIWVAADVLCCTASILNLCAISIDRYQAITSPLNYATKTSPKRMLRIVCSVWLASAFVSLPPLLVLGNEHKNTQNPAQAICTVSQNFWYQIYATMASFYIPLIVMLILYIKILRIVGIKKKGMNWKPQQLSGTPTSSQSLLRSLSRVKTVVSLDGMKPQTKVHRESRNRDRTELRASRKERMVLSLREHKAAATLGIIMTTFTVCWLPFFVLALLRPFSTVHSYEIPACVASIFLWLGYTNSALNPIIYATLNRDFRRPFKEILCLRCSTLDSLMRHEFYIHQFGRGSLHGRKK